jgi:hypothetical protein
MSYCAPAASAAGRSLDGGGDARRDDRRGGGEHQDYVEDCAVCCRPIRFVAVQDPESGDYAVEVYAEI